MRVAKLFAGWALIILLSSSGQVFGQSRETLIMTFAEDVVVGSTVLPKGEYQIINPSPVTPLLQFFSNDRMRVEASTVAMRTVTLKPSDNTKLILEKIGSQYYLTEIWTYGRTNGLEILLPKKARSLQRELKSAGIQPEYRIVLATPTDGGAPKRVSR